METNTIMIMLLSWIAPLVPILSLRIEEFALTTLVNSTSMASNFFWILFGICEEAGGGGVGLQGPDKSGGREDVCLELGSMFG